MKFSFCFLLLTLVIAEANLKAETVFDIPKLSGVQIDGKANDWAEKGFRVGTLAGVSGAVRTPDDFDPILHLGWDDQGLLVFVTVRDSQISEADEVTNLYQKDSVDLYLGSEVGKPHYFQLLTGTGADAKFPTIRKYLKDFNSPTLHEKLTAEVASGPFPGGYAVETRLPWSVLGVTPKIGVEVAFQILVHDADDDGSSFAVSWNPGLDTYCNPKSMNRLRLSDRPPVAADVKVRTLLDEGHPRLELIAPVEFSGKKVAVAINGETPRTSLWDLIEGRARATFLVPLGVAEISGDGMAGMEVDCRDFSATILKGMNNAKTVFKPAVFSGEKFPPCDFEQPAEVRQALGNCTITPTFYDAEFNVVSTASRPGRYGAIVEVKPANGKSFKRFHTLYHVSEKPNRRLAKLKISGAEFPKEFGLDPQVQATQGKTISDLLTNSFFSGFWRGSDEAVVLAGLSEMKPGTNDPPLDRTGPYAADQKWWYELKKRTGNLRQDYYAWLPERYETDTSKKWPLILFLHGSGEKGYDVNQVKATGLAQNLDARKNFPFIVISPQCSPGEWWSHYELNDLLDKLETKYRIDANRIYLTGLSMGGFGSWALAAESPKRFAAVVPICGGGDPADVERIKEIPIWVFHGAKDDAVPLQCSQEMVDALKALGSNVKFTIFPDAGHDSWTAAYAMPELYDWLLQQRLPDK